MYGEWLALHRVLAGKLCYIHLFYIHHGLEPLLNCQCCSSSGVTCHSGVHLKRILSIELGLAVTEINTKKV